MHLCIDAVRNVVNIPVIHIAESLNISVAAAIILQDVTTKLRNSDVDWQL
jgi:tRNA (guanosine-2'-O-)-methyltransferase